MLSILGVFAFGFQNCGNPFKIDLTSSNESSINREGENQVNNEESEASYITIVSPTAMGFYSTKQVSIKVSGTLFGSSTGVIVTWDNNMGGSGKINAVENWSIVNIPLVLGENKITITAKDGLNIIDSSSITIFRKPKPSPNSHPFLIVTESDYSLLRERAIKYPWDVMMADAIATTNSTFYDSSSASGIAAKSWQMGTIVSAGALAYILDQKNKSIYKNKIRDTLLQWNSLYALRNLDWEFAVRAGVAFFQSVLAFDVIYNDLTTTERANIEAQLSLIGEWYMNTNTNWLENLFPCRGIWALWKNNRSQIEAIKSSYRSVFNEQLSQDGVFTEGCGYSGDLGSLTTGTHFMDVLEHLGEDSYYADEKVRNFQEWYFGYSKGPFVQNCTFGDTFLTQGGSGGGSSAAYRAYKFSDKAGRYASRWASFGPAKGNLLNYVLLDQPLPSPERAMSRIFSDGGAWFHEKSTSIESLSGALWNIITDEHIWHTHKDVNAVHLFGYGEHLLRNSGYNGASSGALGYSWSYINNTALSGNTVLINATDHQLKIGKGITEGFTAEYLDYGTGDSGEALSNGKHLRSLVFVHPQDKINGYFLLFDEISTSSSSNSIKVLLHPNSDLIPMVTNGNEYQWKVSPYRESQKDVYLTIFLGTQPQSTIVNNGVLASGSNSFIGKYLESTYSTAIDGKKNIVTVLYPHDALHPKAQFTKIENAECSGANISSSGGFIDTALESHTKNKVSCGGVSFRGLATLFRTIGNDLDFYFVRKGRSFDNGKSLYLQGFETDLDHSVYLKGVNGKIISPGADVVFYYPGIVGVKLNGIKVATKSYGNGFVKVGIPQGTHSLTLIKNNQ